MSNTHCSYTGKNKRHLKGVEGKLLPLDWNAWLLGRLYHLVPIEILMGEDERQLFYQNKICLYSKKALIPNSNSRVHFPHNGTSNYYLLNVNVYPYSLCFSPLSSKALHFDLLMLKNMVLQITLVLFSYVFVILFRNKSWLILNPFPSAVKLRARK